MKKPRAIFLSATLFLSISHTNAEVKTFTGANQAPWDQDGNWTPAGVPTEADDVFIGAASVMIGPGVSARAASVSVASEADYKLLILAGSDSKLTTGVLTLGSEVKGSTSMLQFNSDGAQLNAASIVMSPGKGDSEIRLLAAGVIDIGERSGSIDKGAGDGQSRLSVWGEVGALGIVSSNTTFLILGGGDTRGVLDVKTGQTYSVSVVAIGNGVASATGTGTLNLNGGEVKAELILLNAGEPGVLNNSVINLNSGTLSAKEIIRQHDGNTQIFHWNGGTIANAAESAKTCDLTIGRGGDATQNLVISLSGNGTHAFDVSAGWTAQLESTAVLADQDGGHGALVKTGGGTLEIRSASTFTGATTVDAGELLLTGSGSINSSSGVTVVGKALLTNSSSVPLPKKIGWLYHRR